MCKSLHVVILSKLSLRAKDHLCMKRFFVAKVGLLRMTIENLHMHE